MLSKQRKENESTMIYESYERLDMDVTRFDAEDVITTSGVGPGGSGGGPGGNPGSDAPAFPGDDWGIPLGF